MNVKATEKVPLGETPAFGQHSSLWRGTNDTQLIIIITNESI
jgi:hypothetical protein